MRVGTHVSLSPVSVSRPVTTTTEAKTPIRYRAMSRSTASRASRSVWSISRLPWLCSGIAAVSLRLGNEDRRDRLELPGVLVAEAVEVEAAVRHRPFARCRGPVGLADERVPV